jgi:hypothetical protein
MDRQEIVEFQEQKKVEGKKQVIRTICFKVSILSILPVVSNSKNYEYADYYLSETLKTILEPHVPGHDRENKARSLVVTRSPEIADELLMYGFVQRVQYEPPKGQLIIGRGNKLLHRFVYTDRMERFKYWLAFKGSLPKKLSWVISPATEDSYG